MLQKGKLYRLVDCVWSERYLILFAFPGRSTGGKIEIDQYFTVLDLDNGKGGFVKVLTADGIGYIRNNTDRYTVVECR